MKRFAFFIFLAAGLVPLAAAQETEHVQVGVFADYLRFSQTDSNFGGLGGRVGFVAFKNLKLEAEMGYDFTQTFTENFNNGTGTIATQRSHLRMLHGEFGPKLNLGRESHHFHPFVFVKGGFMNFRLTSAPATFGTFFSNVDDLRTNNVSAVLYPGGGLEGRIGPVGVRADVGDEIYFANNAHHNLRITFGPYIRF
jgi:hypothetical protein